MGGRGVRPVPGRARGRAVPAPGVGPGVGPALAGEPRAAGARLLAARRAGPGLRGPALEAGESPRAADAGAGGPRRRAARPAAGRPWEVAQFLRIAIALAGALRRVHERGLIHKDIKPANILVDVASGGVWLTGFGIASRLPRERQAPDPPEVIAGTLAYMAPEQTGRMNRSIDSRSDLYALGVTFYEMLTGALPFTAADPMEWVHCHIARQPVPPERAGRATSRRRSRRS